MKTMNQTQTVKNTSFFSKAASPACPGEEEESVFNCVPGQRFR